MHVQLTVVDISVLLKRTELNCWLISNDFNVALIITSTLYEPKLVRCMWGVGGTLFYLKYKFVQLFNRNIDYSNCPYKNSVQRVHSMRQLNIFVCRSFTCHYKNGPAITASWLAAILRISKETFALHSAAVHKYRTTLSKGRCIISDRWFKPIVQLFYFRLLDSYGDYRR